MTNNRRRIRGRRGRSLQRQRSEKVERSFAHVCKRGGSRRTWLIGIDKVRNRYLMSTMAHNLGIMMRRLFGMGTARGLLAEGGLAVALYFALLATLRRWWPRLPYRSDVWWIPFLVHKTSFSTALAS